MPRTLKDEFDYYLAHQKDLVEKYNGKVIVIKDAAVIGVFDNEATAVEDTKKNHKLGSFLVQKVEPGEAAYTHYFHSRVTFDSEWTRDTRPHSQ